MMPGKGYKLLQFPELKWALYFATRSPDFFDYNLASNLSDARADLPIRGISISKLDVSWLIRDQPCAHHHAGRIFSRLAARVARICVSII